MYLSEASTFLSKTIQTLVKSSGIGFINSQTLRAQAEHQHLKLVKSQHHQPVNMALFEKI